MEAEEEDVLKVNEPSVPVQNDAVLSPETQEELRRTEPQCMSESLPEPELKPETEGFGQGVEGESDAVPTEDTEIVEELNVAEGYGTEDTEIVEELNVAEGHGTEDTEIVEELNVAEGHGTEDTEIVEELNVAEGHGTEDTEIVEELSVAEGQVTEETEVGAEDEKGLETEKVLSEEGVVAHSAKEAAEKSNVAEVAEETVISWKDQAEEKTAEVEAEEAEAEAEKVQAVGEQAEAEGEKTEAEVEGDDEANVTDMAAETDMVEEVDMADDAMEETTEAEETEAAEEEAEGMEVEVEEEDEETNRAGSGGKRKRGKSSKATGKLLSKKKMEEDVCFICFDGGELVLCDRRGCPKAYHPSCVNRDEAFFRAKGRWNCGWHLCSNCEKNAHYMCYTCTFSLCKGCTKDAVFLCVRGNKGFCETCMKTVMLIEKNEQGNKDTNEVDFDDKTSWEYLFKDYWIDLKERLSLTVDELAQAKNPWKGATGHKQESHDEPYDANNDEGSESDDSENLDLANSKKRKAKKRLRTRRKGKDSSSPATATGSGRPSADDSTGWGSKELLEFVMHMRNGDKSALSQFDVQALLLEYIKRNKLRDPRRKSQIICDLRLQNLFGKPRVGHFEMLKLLESHFLVKEDSQADDLQGSVVDTEGNQLEADGNSDTPAKSGKDKRRKTRKKGDGRGPQSNIDDFAAIDIHNINLIYLKRNLVEDLLDDLDNFGDKVAHSFVRIRISGSGQKQDLYRLVQVIGTCKAAEPYKVGKRMTDILLEILNLNKTEIISIDIISNQDFTEDECKRLRQSIKCGLINRLTVGDVQEKALALQAVRVKDWLETEIVRLSHLRDRASEKGRRKELRECVEKLQLLKTPEERQRRLEETLEIHVDPNMDPSYESEEDEDEGDDKKQESYIRPTGSGFGRKGREPISPRRAGPSSNDSWSGTRNFSSMNRELSRNMSNKGFFNKAENTTAAGEIVNDSWGHGRDRETQQTNHWEKKQNISSLETGVRSTQSAVPSESSPAGGSENSVVHLSTGVAQSAANINESEKIWHYKDPSGKVQGPFSMVQLRKWNHTGYFPANLRVWKNTEKEEDAILVTDALAGKFQKDPSFVDSSFPKAQMVHNSHLSPVHSGKSQGALFQRGTEGQAGGVSWGSQNEINSSSGRGTPQSVEVPKYSSDGWSTTNLPSPTPSQTPLGGARGQAYESNWSPSPARPGGSVLGGNGVLQPTAVVTPESALRASGNDRSSSLPGINAAPKSENATLLGSTTALRMHGQVTRSAPVLSNASMNQVADVNNLVSNLQNLVQSVTSRAPASDARGWVSGSVPNQEMTASGPVPGSESQPWGGAPSQRIEQNNAATVPAQHQTHGYWNNAPSTNNAPSSMNTGNLAGNFPTSGFSGVPHSDPWRPPVPSNHTYIQPPAQPQAPWGVGVPDSQSAVPRTGQENQNTSWVSMAGNPNVTWGGPVPGNTNMNWGPPSQGPGWTAPGQGPVPGNAVTNWVPPGQGPPSVSANPGWAPPGQGPTLGNANHGWSAPNATQNGDRFSNQRDRGSHGDPGFSGGKPWNRQSSFGGGGGGGGSSRPPFRGQRVCRFFESGHCKKGASCDYLHPDH
ncbi:PREDICTED: zinc finger [Prunus dulcis]|uniref:PREDICTED: zinc finger n=1 Tax=Prunus dulcis TaxID=3755 RepID=A0A5E4G0B9_PRUDU|nr:zinc finger CCCH domain-containing protein 19 [Prunus dulcis]VVA33187.1 PREDICTED: zinc finger [Prunus dulcis]